MANVAPPAALDIGLWNPQAGDYPQVLQSPLATSARNQSLRRASALAGHFVYVQPNTAPMKEDVQVYASQPGAALITQQYLHNPNTGSGVPQQISSTTLQAYYINRLAAVQGRLGGAS
jgi:hypothetical protein